MVPVRRSVAAAVTAAQAFDADAFADAVTQLVRTDRDRWGVLLGAMTRDLLEQAHPDGLDADDAQRILDRCAVGAAAWFPAFAADVLLVALAGSLGVLDPDEAPNRDGRALFEHGLLLIADLLVALGQTPARALDTALRELERAQTVELP